MSSRVEARARRDATRVGSTARPGITVLRSRGIGRLVVALADGAARVPWWLAALTGSAAMALLSLPRVLSSCDLAAGGWFRDSSGNITSCVIGDHAEYLRLREHFAGHGPAPVVRPFSDRALGPWLAAHVPLPAAISLWVVNVAVLTLGTFAIALLVRRLVGRAGARVVAAVAVWSLCVPALWYLGRPFVDPMAVGLVPVVVLLCYLDRTWSLAAGLVALVLAIWGKETAVAVVPALAVREWMAGRGRATGARVARTVAWPLAGVVGLLTVGVLAGRGDVLFAPWFPASATTARLILLWNLGTPGRLLQYIGTAAAAVTGVLLCWRNRRRTVAEDAVPLVVGAVVACALGLWSLLSALFDGRTVWVSLPFGAVLVALCLPSLRRSAEVASNRRLVLRWAAGAVAVVLAAVVLAAAARGAWPAAGPQLTRVDPRVASPPSGPTWSVEAGGRGDGVVDLGPAGGGPAVVLFRSEGPLTARSGGIPLASAATSGSLYVDSPHEDRLEISTRGGWEATVVPLDWAVPWEGMSTVRGTGPAVLFVPGALRRSADVDLAGSDPGTRVDLVGGCRRGSCGSLTGHGEVPAGTEVLVVDSPGQWSLVAQGPTPPERATVLADTKMMRR